MIECRGLSKSYGGRNVIDGLDLVISGGICGLLGPNGAGKSTLLGMLSGLVRPNAGEVCIAGQRMTPGDASMRQAIGVLPDHLGLFESLTIWENLCCAGPIYRLTSTETESRAASLLDLLDLARGRDTYARDCSYGMRKKTALALALLHGPRCLLLDEPFEGIDPSSSRAIAEMLRRAASAGITILLTTHILPLLESLSDRVVILKEGRAAWDSGGGVASGTLAGSYFELIGEPARVELEWLG